MKKLVRVLAIALTLCMAAASCMKDPIVEPQGTVAEKQNVREITYTIDGATGHVTLVGESEWTSFMERMLALTEEGHSVTFWNDNNVQTNGAKEAVTYTTADKDDAIRWAKTMTDQGYSVTIDYDATNGVYICYAIKG